MSNDTNELSAAFAPYLQDLAAFRFQLRKFLSFSEVATERTGIQAQQYQLMQVIASLPSDQQSSITYLAERMVLRHNSTVELVDRAERAGLVERRNDAKDLRRSLVVLTPKGDEILRALIAEHMQEVKRVGPELIHALQELINSETE
ncbi:MAG: MarR family transcriptional regulator [Acidobacteriaceae bacterium]|nr:MarR family transcriptional regulator [Acidobacteriaceae bacterium]